jgi:hypothetical protein
MTLDLPGDEMAELARLLRSTIDDDRYPAVAAAGDAPGDPGEARSAEAAARAAATAEGLRCATGGLAPAARVNFHRTQPTVRGHVGGDATESLGSGIVLSSQPQRLSYAVTPAKAAPMVDTDPGLRRDDKMEGWGRECSICPSA